MTPVWSVSHGRGGVPWRGADYRPPRPPGEPWETVALPGTRAPVVPLRDELAVTEALASPACSVGEVGWEYFTSGNRDRDRRVMLLLDGQRRTDIRRAVAPSMSATALERQRPFLLDLAARAAGDFAGSAPPGRLRPRDATRWADRFAGEFVCHNLGVPSGEWPFVRRNIDAGLALIRTGSQAETDTIVAAWQQIYRFTASLVAEKQARPDGRMFSAAVAALSTAGYGSDEDLIHTCSTIISGLPTILSVLSAGLIYLLRHPGLVEQCRRDPARWPAVVDQVLDDRAHFSWTGPRVATEDVTLSDGRVISQGTVVLPCITAAIRDNAAAVQKKHRRLAYGYGKHRCPADRMSDGILQIAWAAFFDAAPWRLAVPSWCLRWHDGLLATPHAIPVTRQPRWRPSPERTS